MSAIGIVGGVGPMAGTDLANKVFLHTKAKKDQDHIRLFLTSCPSIIPDRTDYLLSGGADPAPGLEKCIGCLAQMGATAVGIACNTAHAPAILGRVNIPDGVKLINMIKVTSDYVDVHYPGQKVGLLSTLGTMKTGVYNDYFKSIVVPDMAVAQSVHDAIYDKIYGIKALSGVSETAFRAVSDGVLHLKDKGCTVVILGCTELPLVFKGSSSYCDVSLVDPTEILACELILATEPDKLLIRAL